MYTVVYVPDRVVGYSAQSYRSSLSSLGNGTTLRKHLSLLSGTGQLCAELPLFSLFLGDSGQERRLPSSENPVKEEE